jgi:biofilm PGA synthesis N-glycosyltransferase PgaC
MEPMMKVIVAVVYLLTLYLAIFWIYTLLEKNRALNRESRKRRSGIYPFVTVIIPCFNKVDTVKECIESVFKLDYPSDKIELIVVDDGSTDGSSSVIEHVIGQTTPIPVHLIKQRNYGKAKSLNNALKLAKGEFFACLDADSFVDRAALNRMVCKYQEFDDELVILTPSMKIRSPKNLLQKMQRAEYINSVFLQRLMGHVDCIYVAPGPFSLYRTDVITRLGGFAENNLTEDQEIAYRVQEKHYKIRQCHDVAPATIGDFYRQRNRWFKGTLHNLFKYRKMMFNTEYGDFGVFQMPFNILVYILGMFALMMVWVFMIWPAIRQLNDLYLVNFDIWPYLKDLDFSFNWLALDMNMLVLAYIMLGLAIFIFIISHKLANEKVKEYGLLYLFPYFFAYYILISVISTIVFIEVLIGRKQKW